METMSNATSIIPQRRSRGRPKKSVNYATLAGYTNLNRPPSISSKRKQVEEPSDDIQILSTNGIECIQSAEKPMKRSKVEEKRCLPHRAARFTESYGGSPDVVVVSDDENRAGGIRRGGGEDDDEEESESESDSECSPIPSPEQPVKTKEELQAWESNIERLKKELNDEEMKLVLLRKLKDSQKAKDPKTETNGSPAPAVLSASSSQKNHMPVPKSYVQPPLPSKQLLTNKFIPIKKETRPNPVPLTNNGPQRHSSPGPVTLKNETQSNTAPSASSSNQLKSNALNQQYPLLKNLSNQITVTPVPAASSPTNLKTEEKVDAEAIYQRQAAAKLALRKQLEKTLLQIPLPKPPPLKINFFPNANSVEFLCLLGLDCVVDFLTRTKKDSPRNQPLCCGQCSTDFTCAWKWKEVDKNGKKMYDVFCEACINSNIRKSLKAQHTNNLKAAFLKALQQEKEIDRLSQTLTKSHSSSREREPRQKSSFLPVVSAPTHQPPNSSAYSVPKSGTTLTYIPKPSSAMNHVNLGQVGKLNPQFQSLLQAQAQHLLASGVPLHPNVLSLTSFMPPSTHSQGRSSTGQPDFRRQYRQDRTQSPSVPPAHSSWKA